MPKIIQSLFSEKKIPCDAIFILENFEKILQEAIPQNAKQNSAILKQIQNLSRLMTSERSDLRLGYMNEKIFLFAYARYFLWWNLVRLARLFSNLDFSFLREGDVCLDVGSGPLTVAIALWLCRPELRKKKLVWHAMDISQNALILGEKIFSLVAKKTLEKDCCKWKIVRIKGSFGRAAKEKASLVFCSNVFNEILQNKNPFGKEFYFSAKKISKQIFSYLKEDGAVFLSEPGIPTNARFLSFVRSEFLQNGFSILAPCTHSKKCPMQGFRSQKKGAASKWCNFSFDAKSSPKALLDLSKKADLPKERAALSFLFAKKCPKESRAQNAKNFLQEESFRIVSNKILLPNNECGYYACSKSGFSLLKATQKIRVFSGDLLLGGKTTNARDAKTAAPIFLI